MINTVSLKENHIFRKIIKQGKYVCNDNIVIYFLYNNKDMNRLGICVSKKQGNSVERNKIKRWVREVYRKIEKSVKVGIDVIVLFKKESKFENLSYVLVEDEMVKCIEKLQIIVGEEYGE